LKNQDGGGGHLGNHKNRDISATVLLTFTKFGTTMQIRFIHRSDRLKI